MKSLLVILTLFLSACTTVTEEDLKQCYQQLNIEKAQHKKDLAELSKTITEGRNAENEIRNAVAMFEYCKTFPNQDFAVLCDFKRALLGQELRREGIQNSNVWFKFLLFIGTAMIVIFPISLTALIFFLFFDRLIAFISRKLKLSKLEDEAKKHEETIKKAKKLEAEFEATQIAMNADLEVIERDTENAAVLFESYKENIESLKAQKQQLEEEVSELERKKSSAEEALKISDF